MRKFLVKYLKHFIALSTALFLLGGQPIEFGKDKTFFHGYMIPKPIVRIGLGTNLGQIRIFASSGMKVYEVSSHYKLIADDTDAILLKGSKENFNEKFVIQIAQAEDQEEAESIKREWETRIGRRIYLTRSEEDGADGVYKVKIGDFLTRGEALKHIVYLNQLGIKDPWILREQITADTTKPLWILVNDELKPLHSDTALYFIPSNPQSYLTYNGRDYRGILTLKATQKGMVLINTLNIEEYLKSVVPSELSPYGFPEIEAHKAQAVAARTYAINNLGLNDELGFDIDATPNSQFYKGMQAEHSLSNLAVEQTRGEVALHRGKLINALYTSTCGGRTENVENVFSGPPLPYLRSTECVYERQKTWLLKSEKTILPIYVSGQNISLEVASLISLGVIPFETRPAFFAEVISSNDLSNWINKASSLLGKSRKVHLPEKDFASLKDLVYALVEAFEWRERVVNLLQESEKKFILKEKSAGNLETDAYLAYLIQSCIVDASEEIGNLNRALTRGEVVLCLWKMLQTYQNFTDEGIFRTVSEGHIELEAHKELTELAVPPNAFLLRNYEGIRSFVTKLSMIGGERVRWIEAQGNVFLLEVIYPAYSNILDRSSAYHNWQVRISREDLGRKVNQFYPIGELNDLMSKRRGASKRVVELLIDGENTQALVKGLRIRKVLGLRETLFVIDREYGGQGEITHFTFRGKGWGHGVGLCQVGAFGMAQAGASYKEILKKYYHGIKIGKIY